MAQLIARQPERLADALRDAIAAFRDDDLRGRASDAARPWRRQAGAWRDGQAWNACAPITMPMKSRIGTIATSGMIDSSSAVNPRKHITPTPTPVASE